MNMMRRYLPGIRGVVLGVLLASLAFVALGCNRSGMGARSDSQIATDVQNKINADNSVPEKQITINSNNGVVTLSGSVASETTRTAAANDAAQVDGVKTVVNNLSVGAAQTAANSEPAQPAPAAAPTPEPQAAQTPAPVSHARSTHARKSSPSQYNDNGGDNGLRTTVPPTSNSTVASNSSSTGSNGVASEPSTPPPPQKINIPSGTQVSIRLSDEVDSEKAQVGDIFHGAISSPITIDGQTVVPNSADVEGRVVEVKSAGRFAGQSVLTLELTRLMMNGKSYNLQTDRWSKSGNGRGKSTAAKVGGGAAVGAVLGGIFGGGKGAAIGAAAGAGAGTGASAINKGQQIDLKPETVLNFQLQNSITVTPGTSRQPMQ
jgi:hypothetical protein